ncbi:MAG: hypothetical protein RL712_1305 [Bacteroidota bacterium]
MLIMAKEAAALHNSGWLRFFTVKSLLCSTVSCVSLMVSSATISLDVSSTIGSVVSAATTV